MIAFRNVMLVQMWCRHACGVQLDFNRKEEISIENCLEVEISIGKWSEKGDLYNAEFKSAKLCNANVMRRLVALTLLSATEWEVCSELQEGFVKALLPWRYVGCL